MKRRFTNALLVAGALLIGLTVAVQFVGCGGGGDDSSVSATTGTLQVGLTDKKSDEYESVVVAIKEVRVVPDGMDNAADNDPGLPVIATFSPARTVDIMQLRYQQELLGSATVPAGSYNQVRLILEPTGPANAPVNYLTLKTAPGVRLPLTTPSGQQSGLKVLGHFTVEPGVINAIMIDFDPTTAIVERGNGDYNLKPTGIRIVELSSPLYGSFGTIEGTVVSLFEDFSSATVSVVPTGAAGAVASGRIFSAYSSNRWEAPFTSFVPGGVYRVHVQSSGFEPYSTAEQNVVSGQTVSVGELSLVPRP
jgi:hypothetical protein